MTDEEFEDQFNAILNNLSEEELWEAFRAVQEVLKEATSEALRENCGESMRIIRQAILAKHARTLE